MTTNGADGFRAIVTDLGGVLLTSPLPGFVKFQEQSGVDLAVLRKAMRSATDDNGVNPLFELECGRLTMDDFAVAMTAAVAAEVGRPVDMSPLMPLMWQALGPNTPMIELMTALRAEGHRMALLTNNVREWSPHWRALLPVDEIFHVVVDSAFVGLRKPDAAIYELTLSELGARAEECLFVDDIEINCTAATELGMTSVHFRDTDQAIAEIRAQLLEPRRSQR